MGLQKCCVTNIRRSLSSVNWERTIRHKNVNNQVEILTNSNQLLSITHEIHKNLDANPSIDTIGIFLDMSKAFDKVWLKGLICKLQSYGIQSNLLSLLKNYLSDRTQRVILNGVTYSWKPIKSGVPQGSILGPLLFLIFINDLVDNLACNPKLFADDVSLNAVMHDKNIGTKNLRDDLAALHTWSTNWKMVFNPDY